MEDIFNGSQAQEFVKDLNQKCFCFILDMVNLQQQTLLKFK